METLFALDADDGSRVVIKRVRTPLPAAAREKLTRDLAGANAALGARLRLRSEGAQLVLARPYVAGATLAERIAAGRLPAREVIALALDLVDLLERIHAVGVVHGDIKPSNIVLTADRAVLIDFGLARHAFFEAALDVLPPETLAYLAPEQSGLLKRGVDARTDLFALGVCLYQALTGRLPFSAASVSELLRQQLAQRAPPPSSLVAGAPAALDQILERMLAKEPADRYQSAAGARADLAALAAALDAGEANPTIAVGALDRRTALAQPGFVGRAAELAALERALADTAAGRGGLLLVIGPSGSGKSRLLDELGCRAAALGAWVLHGEGLDQSAQRPYQVLSGMAGEIVAALARDEPRAQAIAARVGPLAAVICEALPELGPVLAPGAADARAASGPTEHGEARSLIALDALLDALGAAARPALVVLDDGQWADAATLRLLARWRTRARPGPCYTLVVLAVRTEGFARPAVAELALSPRVELQALSDAEVRRLVGSMAGPVPASVADLTVEHAAGNPLLAVALLQALESAGALTSADGGRWQLDPHALAGLRLAGRIDDLLLARLDRLERPTRALLTVGAVLGRTFDPVLAGALLGLPAAEAITHVEACRGSLVWAAQRGGTYTILHDRIRDALLVSLDDAERRDLHRRAAETLAASEPERVFELAYHFDAAGEPASAFPYALEAGKRARAQWDLESAERQLRIAAQCVSQVPASAALDLARTLGEVLQLRNRYDEAERWLVQARSFARDPRRRAEIEELFCLVELKRGNLRAACGHAEAALRLLGRHVPGSDLTCTAACLWEAGVQVLHTYLPRLFVGRRALAGAGDDLFAARLLFHLNGPYFLARGAVWAAWSHLRHLNLAERYPPTMELGRACAQHAPMLSGFPSLFARGRAAATRGAALCQARGDLWGQARAIGNLSMVLHFSSRFSESLAAARESVQLFDRIGDHWEANTYLCFAATSLLRLGDLGGALATARDLWQRGRDSGAEHACAWALDVWARATDGQVPVELVAEARRRAEPNLQSWIMLSQAEAVRLLGAGQAKEAQAVLEEALRRNRKEARFFHDQNTPLLVFRLAALRIQAEQTSPLDPRARARLLAQAHDAAGEALRVARRFRNSLPHALREAALVSAMRGDVRAARAQIDESVAVAAALGERYEHALSRQARGRLGALFHWPGAAAEAEEARAAIESMRLGAVPGPAAVTPSLLDRFDALLEAGRGIVTALSPPAVHAALREAAMALLRPERCSILEPWEGGYRLALGDAGTSFARELLDEAVRARAPVTRALRDGPSALCAPVFARGRLVAWLYLAHRRVSDLFDAEEQRIAGFLATLAGAALENADGFSKLETLSRELEQRVAERTDQLLHAGRMAAVGTLIAGISHEINNPLAAILGNAQVALRMAAPDAPLRTPLAAIERQATRAAKLVKALLGFSRSELSERVPLAPDELLANTMALLAGPARARRVTVRVRTADDLPKVSVCPQEIESALLNLLINALDATPSGGAVEVTADRASREHDVRVCFTIRDSGSGIPADALPRIFDPFFTTKPPGRGTGLGLPITRQIVAAHGGELDVDSAEGAGTTVRVWLPVAERPA